MDLDSLSDGEKEDLEIYEDHPLADSPYWGEVVATARRARSRIRDTLETVRRQQRGEERRSQSPAALQHPIRTLARYPSIQSEGPLASYSAPSTPYRQLNPTNASPTRWISPDPDGDELPPPSSSAPLSNVPSTPSFSVRRSARFSTPLTSPTSPTRFPTKPSPSIPTPSRLRLTSPPLEFPQSPVTTPDVEMQSPSHSPIPLILPRRRSPAAFPDLDAMPVDSYFSPLSQVSADDPFLDHPAPPREAEAAALQEPPPGNPANSTEDPIIPPEGLEGRRLRTRTFNQIHPYLYDKARYKRQLQHHPDAIVKFAELGLRHSSPASDSYEVVDDSQMVPASPPSPRAPSERRPATDETRSRKRKRTPPRPVNCPTPHQRNVATSSAAGTGAASSSVRRRERSVGASSSMSEDDAPDPKEKSVIPVVRRWYPPQFDSSSDDGDDEMLSSSPRLHRLQKGKRSPSPSVISIPSGSEASDGSPGRPSLSPRLSHSPERFSSPPQGSPLSPPRSLRYSSPEILDSDQGSPPPVHKPQSPIPVYDISDSENDPESDREEAQEVYPIFARYNDHGNASLAKRAKILRPSSRANAPSSSRRPRADAHRAPKRSGAGHSTRVRRQGESRRHRSSANTSGSRQNPRREHAQTSHRARHERDQEPAPRHRRRRRHNVGHNVTTFVSWSRLESGRVHRGPVNVDLEDEDLQQALARPRPAQAQPSNLGWHPPPLRINQHPPTHAQPAPLDIHRTSPLPHSEPRARTPPSRTDSQPAVFGIGQRSPPPPLQSSHPDLPATEQPVSTSRPCVELAKETVPLPGGHHLGQESYLGKGWLRELLDWLTGERKPNYLLSECRVADLPWSLTSSSSVQNLADFIGPACDAFFKFTTSSLVQNELSNHWAAMHRLCTLASWISHKAPVSGDEASWTRILTCCAGLINSIEQWHNFSTSSLDARHPYLYWFAVELLVRLHARDPANKPPFGANAKIPIVAHMGGLVQMLLRAGLREKAFPPAGSVHLHNPTPLEDAVKSIWICLIHVCGVLTDNSKQSFLPKFPQFWGLVADSWTATGDLSSDVAISETVWNVVFALCPLTQYGALGFSGSECHAPPPWRLVIHGISKIRLTGDHEQDSRFPHTVLATRDDYIHTIVLRCLRLAQGWKWRADEKAYMIVDKLADVYRSRKFADLLGEHANFAPFVKENDPSLLKEPYDSGRDNTFSALLKLAYAVGNTPEGRSQLTKLTASLMAIRRLQLSGEDLEPQQASMLFNKLSAVALAVELDRSSAGFNRHLNGLSGEMLFAESGEALRAICRQAVKHFTMQALRLSVPLDAVLAWFSKMMACLVREYCQGACQPKTSPELAKAQEASKGIKKLLSLLAKAAAYSIEVDNAPNCKLLECQGISEVFAGEDKTTSRPFGKSVRDLVDVYLDFCQSKVPPTSALMDPAGEVTLTATAHPQSARTHGAVELSVVGAAGDKGNPAATVAGHLGSDPDIQAAVPIRQDEDEDDSQDLWKYFSESPQKPEPLILPESSLPSPPAPAADEVLVRSILEVVNERVQKPVFDLIGQCHTQPEAGERLARKEWIDCWSSCVLALLRGGVKDLTTYFQNRISPWGSIPNPWRHYARLSLSYLVLSRYPAAYRHKDFQTFYVQVWLDCLIVYRSPTHKQLLEDRFMSLLLKIDKAQHPLFQNLPMDFQDDLTNEAGIVQDDALQNTVSAISEIEEHRGSTGTLSVIPLLVDMLDTMHFIYKTLHGDDEKRYKRFIDHVSERIECEPSLWSEGTVYDALKRTRSLKVYTNIPSVL